MLLSKNVFPRKNTSSKVYCNVWSKKTLDLKLFSCVNTVNEYFWKNNDFQVVQCSCILAAWEWKNKVMNLMLVSIKTVFFKILQVSSIMSATSFKDPAATFPLLGYAWNE